MTRSTALAICEEESRPRYDSLLWYCETIGLDPDVVFATIDEVPRMYDF